MEWVPIVLVTFKVVVFGIGMFFAIKWHYDQEKETEKSDVLRAAGTVAVIFMVSLLGLIFATFTLAGMLGLDLTFP